MNINSTNEQNIIERDVHCPYCQSEKALLLSGLREKRTTLQFPAYGKKYWLCVIFTFGLYMLVHGFPMFEKKRTYEYTTYGFCPNCGKSYNAGAPAAVAAKNAKTPKVYRSLFNKKLFGVCGGIAEFTGLSVKLIRIVMIIYAFSFYPAIIYFILGTTDIMPVNSKQLSNQQNNQIEKQS